jgi:hypothetical protein
MRLAWRVGETEHVAARDLVVRPGRRVSAAGRYVAREDGDWLDMALVNDLMFHPPGWKTRYSLPLLGLDPARVPSDWGPDRRTLPGWVRVIGVWDGIAITVDEQAPVHQPRHVPPTFRPPCAPPTEGWDRTTSSRDVPELEGLRASGAIAADCWMREDGGAVVLIVAATHVELVHSALGPRLPRRLCVVASRYSAEHVREVHEVLNAPARDWGLQIWSAAGLDQDGQPHAHAELVRVTDDLAAWADTLPDGLLDLRPTIIPA